MDTKQFSDLRKRVEMTQALVAEALGVTSRTISAWETANPIRDLSRPEAKAIRDLFRGPLLENHLWDLCGQAFDLIPSEMVSIWLVEEQNCLLLPRATRLHDLEKKSALEPPGATLSAPLVIRSLTTFPLQSAEILNLSGDEISWHPHKRFKGTRGANFLASGRTESLLHVPAFTPSHIGPRPVLLLSLQNKLDEHGAVIMPGKGGKRIYTNEDVRSAKALAQQFKDVLLTDMRGLDMLQ